MINNWYKFSIEELEVRRAKLANWLFEYPKHEKKPEVEEALSEICEVMKTLQEAKNNPNLQSFIDMVLK